MEYVCMRLRVSILIIIYNHLPIYTHVVSSHSFYLVALKHSIFLCLLTINLTYIFRIQ